MNLLEYYKDIVEQYPPFITQIQLCEITGICQSSAYKLLKSGEISHKKRNKKLLHYYDIPLIEALQYKFSKELICILKQGYASTIRSYYEIKLQDDPDALSSKDIHRLTGYTAQSIERWLLNKEMEAFMIRQRYYIAKDDLLDFLVSDRFLDIPKKSPQHLSDIEAIKKMCFG